MAIKINTEKRIFTLETKHTMYQMQADTYGVLRHLWYGAKTGCDMSYLQDYPDVGFSGNPHDAGNDRTYSLDTLPLAQLNFQTQFGTNYNLAFASYLLALIPILIFYIFCQKQIIGGIANGAVKG